MNFYLKIGLSGLDSLISLDEDRKLAADVPRRQERQSVNMTKVEDLVCSQEDTPGTHESPRAKQSKAKEV